MADPDLPKGASPTITSGNTVLLANAMPEAEYMYGCTPTALGMLLGYYDLYGYRGTDLSNIIEGVVALKSRGTDGNAYDMDAFDTVLGRAIASEDYVYRFHSRNGKDTTPSQELEYTFQADGKTLNTDVWNCIADYIGTGQFWRGNGNLSTSISYGSIEELYEYEFNEPITDGTTTKQVRYIYTTMLYGLDLYLLSRGYELDYEITGSYAVDVCGGDFTFEDYMREIDSGRPVLISIQGHSMVGYGYNAATREIVFDDCYQADQSMVWDGTYYYSGANRALQSITVVGINVSGEVDLSVATTAGSSEKVIVSDRTNALSTSDYIFAGAPVYLTFTVSNEGLDPSGAFRIAVRVDGKTVSSSQIDSLNADASRKFADVSLGNLSVGLHNVRVTVDETNAIQEWSGLNNTAETDVLVLKPGTNVLTGLKSLNDWKTASDTFVYGGGTLNLTDARALDTVLRGSITSRSANGTVWYLPARANVSEGGYMSSTDVYSYGELSILSGGTVCDTRVFSDGLAYVAEGGVASGVTVGAYGELTVSSGGLVTGRLRFDSAADVTFYDGGILNFDLTNALPGGDVCVNDLSVIYGSPDFTITVSDMLDNGTYKLADGATGFKRKVTVYDSDGIEMDSFKPGGSFYVGKAKYTLKLTDDSLTLTISGKIVPDIVPPTVTGVNADTSAPTKQPVTVTAVFSDNVALASSLYRVGEEGAWNPYSGGVTVAENAIVYFKAVDEAGNESEIVSCEVTNIDKYMPVLYSGVVLKSQTAAASFNDHYQNAAVSAGGRLILLTDGTADSTDVFSGGVLDISSGGRADGTFLYQNGRINVFSSGVANDTVVFSGTSPDSGRGVLNVSSGGTANNTVLSGGELWLESGGTVNVASVRSDGWLQAIGGTANDVVVGVGGLIQFAFGATANDAVVAGGRMEVYETGVANRTIVSSGGEDAYLRVYGDGVTNSATVSSGGCIVIDGGGIANDTTVLAGGCMVLGGGGIQNNIDGVANRTEVKSGGSVIVYSGCSASELAVSRGGVLVFDVTSYTYVQGTSYGSAFKMEDGFLSGFAVDNGGEVHVSSGGLAYRTTISSGWLCVSGGGTASSAGIRYGGDLYLGSGGTASEVDLSFGGGLVFEVAPSTYLQGTSCGSAFEMKNGYLSGYAVGDGCDVYVLSGGLAEQTAVDSGGILVLHSGGRETGTTVGSGGCFIVSGGTATGVTVDDGILHISAGGVALDTVVSGRNYGVLHTGLVVSEGGVAYDTDVREMEMSILGGAASGVTLHDGAKIILDDGGLLTGRMTFENGATVSVLSGEFNFNVTDAVAGAPALVNDLSAVSGDPLYTLTVDAASIGTYSLADGASDFSGTLTVLDPSGAVLGTLAPGRTVSIRKVDHTLTLYKGSLIVSIGEPGPDIVAPTVGGIKASTKAPTNQPVTVTAVFSDNVGVTSALYRIGDEGEWTAYENGVTVTTNETVYFKAVDAAGNESEIVSYAVTNIDVTPPDRPEPSADLTEPTKRRVMVSAEFGTDAALKEYSLDGAVWAKYSGAVKMTENGTVYFRGTDAAGNVSEIAEYEVGNIDKSLPDDGPDSGWNDYLYNKKKGLNPDAGSFPATALADGFSGGIQVDAPGSVSVDGRVNFVGKYDEGYVDEYDYAKITLETAAKLSFSVDATDSVKLSVCRLNETTDKNGKVTRSLKTLQTTPIPRKKDAASVRSDTKGLLLEAGEYYIAMQSTNAAKGGSAYYNLSLNDEDSVFFTKGDGSDDWNDLKSKGAEGAVGSIGEIDENTGPVLDDWVGFGDAADYRLFTIEHAAKLFFLLNATDAAKFAICRLDSKTDRKGVTTYSLKQLQSTKLSKPKNADEYTAETKGLLLEAGQYCVLMQSTNAAKGGSADYSVTLNAVASEFFTKGDNSDNWGDLKTKGEAGAVVDAGTLTSGAGLVLEDWVGFGDAVDYRLFTTGTDAQLSFRVSASDKAKFTICRLEEKTDRKGVTTYSLKQLQSTTLKKWKGGEDYLATTKLLSLEAGGRYCFAVQSTNAKSGGSASYRVDLEDSSVFADFSADALSSAMPETLSEPVIPDASDFGTYAEPSFAGVAVTADIFPSDDSTLRAETAALA